ncbi:PucR family transcriptional regulator [Caldanaerobacter subterraneus]|uniref:PucR family transcriptional regulator n=1 Tax=Caldanaerobacter subterraneus TaxID=911092 RepID=UPI003464BC3E
MSITVEDALKLKGLDKARLVAGEKGIKRRIQRVSVIECPESPELFAAGDFFITAFYAFKDDEKAQFDIVKSLVDSGSSGLCIIDLYLSDVSDEIKQYANNVGYPIIILPNDVPYGEIITNIMNAIIQSKEETIKEMLIDKLVNTDRNKEEIIEIVKQINPNFKEKMVAIFSRNWSRDVYKDILLLTTKIKIYSHWSLVKYRGGILFILTFYQENKSQVEFYIKEYLKELTNIDENFKIGISNFHEGFHEFGIGIEEALIAVEISEKLNDRKMVFYRDLGLYKLLLPLKDQPEIKSFKEEIINPIKKYDKENSTNLLKTAISYVENDGDLYKTAKDMFQHVNTIRYRINKIKEILHMEHLNNNNFYEQLSIAIKIYKLLDNKLNLDSTGEFAKCSKRVI